MSAAEIPLDWILEYVLNNLNDFNEHFIQGSTFYCSLHADAKGMLDEIALAPDQPQIPPIALIALLQRIVSSPDSIKACDPDADIYTTLEYLELLEAQRLKRIKAIATRGSSLTAEVTRTSKVAQSRYAFALTSLKYWVKS